MGSAYDNKDGWTKTSDLDVYVPNKRALKTMRKYLRDRDGYEPLPIPKLDEGRYWEDPACIKSLTRLRSPLYNAHIDIICAQGNAATLPITAFWGTPVMNFITGTKLVVLYPRMTLDGRGFYNPHSHPDRRRESIAKYSARGITVTAFPHDRKQCTDPDNYCPETFRYTQDTQTMCVSWSAAEKSPSVTAKTPSFRHVEYVVTPTYWRWSTCPHSQPHSIGNFVGVL